jgi:hypothetical protein
VVAADRCSADGPRTDDYSLVVTVLSGCVRPLVSLRLGPTGRTAGSGSTAERLRFAHHFCLSRPCPAYVRDVRRRILEEHRDTVAAVVEAGTAVASALDDQPVTDGGRVRRPLDAVLTDRGLKTPLLDLLVTGAQALDATVRGRPVAAPPYLVVTSRGPLCRGTLADGGRLVVELSLFSVESRPRRYRFHSPTVEECLTVTRT